MEKRRGMSKAWRYDHHHHLLLLGIYLQKYMMPPLSWPIKKGSILRQ
jgi:hypothetical protein